MQPFRTIAEQNYNFAETKYVFKPIDQTNLPRDFRIAFKLFIQILKYIVHSVPRSSAERTYTFLSKYSRLTVASLAASLCGRKIIDSTSTYPSQFRMVLCLCLPANRSMVGEHDGGGGGGKDFCARHNLASMPNPYCVRLRIHFKCSVQYSPEMTVMLDFDRLRMACSL